MQAPPTHANTLKHTHTHVFCSLSSASTKGATQFLKLQRQDVCSKGTVQHGAGHEHEG